MSPTKSVPDGPPPHDPADPADMTQLVDTAEVIICCGSGGVGKTTTAAVIGRDRKSVV